MLKKADCLIGPYHDFEMFGSCLNKKKKKKKWKTSLKKQTNSIFYEIVFRNQVGNQQHWAADCLGSHGFAHCQG